MTRSDDDSTITADTTVMSSNSCATRATPNFENKVSLISSIKHHVNHFKTGNGSFRLGKDKPTWQFFSDAKCFTRQHGRTQESHVHVN